MQRVWASTAGSRWDREVHVKIAPLIYQYHLYPIGGKERAPYCEKILGSIFRRFRDIHPDFIGFESSDAALWYVNEVRAYVHGHAGEIKKRLAAVTGSNSGLTHSQAGALIKSVLRKRLLSRPHDLWANSEAVRETLRVAFDKQMEEHRGRLGASKAETHRAAFLQEFRALHFQGQARATRIKYTTMSKDPNLEDVDPELRAYQLQQMLGLVVDYVGTESGSPILLASGTRSIANPGTVDIYM